MTRHDNVESPTGRTGLNLFMDFGSVPGSESEWTIESIRERADTVSEVLEGILRRAVPHPRWGINE